MEVKRSLFPSFYVTKREAMPFWKSWLIRAISILCALIVCGIMTALITHINPLKFYSTVFDGAMGTTRRIWNLLQNMSILLCISVALTPAFRMRFWNIGGEGQVLIGGMATAICMIVLGSKLPLPLLFVVMLFAALAAGAIWATIPAIFKAKWNTNETLFTLMMNYIAIQIVSFFSLKWSVPKGSGQIGVINQQSHIGWLPRVFGNQYLLPILIVLAVTVFMYFYLRSTKHGYEIAVVGESVDTARYIGLRVPKVMIRTLLLSGALCGLTGFLLVSGVDHTIAPDTAAGRGFTAIMVSWLAKFNTFYMILTSLLLVFMQKGASEISTVYGLNDAFSEILTGIIIFFIIGSEFFIQYRVHAQRMGKGEEK
ncbi:MAG: ABC transporter permease [Peptoniphilaceae bacterium]|nr:ABC transporter permease [Peptoniphilaceae bacterium]MDY3075057.1 ABC transporter permease [Peptoniphilaceae bacterium]